MCFIFAWQCLSVSMLNYHILIPKNVSIFLSSESVNRFQPSFPNPYFSFLIYIDTSDIWLNQRQINDFLSKENQSQINDFLSKKNQSQINDSRTNQNDKFFFQRRIKNAFNPIQNSRSSNWKIYYFSFTSHHSTCDINQKLARQLNRSLLYANTFATSKKLLA